MVDDVRIACRHHEQQSPLDRPDFRNTRCMGHSPGRTLGPVLHTQQPPAITSANGLRVDPRGAAAGMATAKEAEQPRHQRPQRLLTLPLPDRCSHASAVSGESTPANTKAGVGAAFSSDFANGRAAGPLAGTAASCKR